MLNNTNTDKDVDTDTDEFCCQCCFEEIVNENMVKYQINQNNEWLVCNYCDQCVIYLQNKSWKIYTDQVKQADCKKALIKLIDVGPPVNLRDRVGFPNPLDKHKLTEIDNLMFCKNNEIKSAKLKDSLIGNEREKYIEFIKNFKFNE